MTTNEHGKNKIPEQEADLLIRNSTEKYGTWHSILETTAPMWLHQTDTVYVQWCWDLHLCHSVRHKKMKSDRNKMNMQKRRNLIQRRAAHEEITSSLMYALAFLGCLSCLVLGSLHCKVSIYPANSPNTAHMLSPTYKDMNALV